jgi:hypothetical protein
MDDKENEPVRLQSKVGSFHILTEKIPLSAQEGNVISSQEQAAPAVDTILSLRSSTNVEVDLRLSVSSNLLAENAQDSLPAISMTVSHAHHHSQSIQPAAENETTQSALI